MLGRRPWLWGFAHALAVALGLVMGIVSLMVLPWPLVARLLLGVVAVVLAALGVGFKPRSGLAGRKVLKIPAKPRENVSLVELRDGGDLVERWIPLGPSQESMNREPRRGIWRQRKSELSMAVVDGDHLVVRLVEQGLWKDAECYAQGSQGFLAVIVDPLPVKAGRAWVGVRLGMNGERRIVYAEADGNLRERNPFGDTPDRTGHWHVDPQGDLHIVVARWHLTVSRRRRPGIYLGTEYGDAKEQEFAFVRVVVAL